MSTEGDPPGGPPDDVPAPGPISVDTPSKTTPAPITDPVNVPAAAPSTTRPLADAKTGSTADAKTGPTRATDAKTGPTPAAIADAKTGPTSAALLDAKTGPARVGDAVVSDSSDAAVSDSSEGDSTDDLRRKSTRTPILEAPPATEDSILPLAYDEHALQDAVGAKRSKRTRNVDPLDENGLPDDRGWSKRTILVVVVATIAGLGIAALVLLGRINAARYFLTCKTDQAVAERGRAFPPWGSAPLPGAEWKPIALPANAQCQPQEVDDRGQLEGRFLELLLERTSVTLTNPNFLEAPLDGKPVGNPLELVSIQLEQALLLSRGPERGDQRKQVERLQGDVQYWRASLRLRDATAALADASRQFDQAALARPMHVTDAGAWAEFLRRLADELKAGPNGVPAGFPPAPTATGTGTGAPQGTALPVEPEPSAAGSDAPASTPDAGVPTGGVLL